MVRLLRTASLISLPTGFALAQAPNTPPGAPPGAGARPARPAPPTRDPNTPGYVKATDLPDGQLPPVNTDGNYIIGPTHNPAPEMAVKEGVPQGTVVDFTMSSAD